MGCVMNRGGLRQILALSWTLRTPLRFPRILPVVERAGPLLRMGGWLLGDYRLFIFCFLFLFGCLVVIGCRVISLGA